VERGIPGAQNLPPQFSQQANDALAQTAVDQKTANEQRQKDVQLGIDAYKAGIEGGKLGEAARHNVEEESRQREQLRLEGWKEVELDNNQILFVNPRTGETRQPGSASAPPPPAGRPTAPGSTTPDTVAPTQVPDTGQLQGKMSPEQKRYWVAGTQAQEAHLITKQFEDAQDLPRRTTTAVQPLPGSSMVTSTASQEFWAARNKFLDALAQSGETGTRDDWDKTYFAQPGDGRAVIQQKQAARTAKIQGLSTLAGRPLPNVTDTPAARPGGTTSSPAPGQPSGPPPGGAKAAPGTPQASALPPPGTTVSEADIQTTMAAKGKSRAAVIAAFKHYGYKVQGQ
jgi:hypothetical protein